MPDAGREATVIIHDGRVSFIVNNREFEVVVAPILVGSMGLDAAAEATAQTLREALSAPAREATSTAREQGLPE